MALKALMLRKKIDLKKKELDALRAKQNDLEKREAELVVTIDEVTNEEEQQAVQESVDALIEEKEKLEESAEALDQVIKDLEKELDDAEAAQNTDPAPAASVTVDENERSKKPMNLTTRNKIFSRMSVQERDAFFAREDVKNYLHEVRTAIKEKRAINNVGLLIPQVFLPLLRENIENYSKLYRHVRVVQINGDGVLPIMGTIPEAIWTDCCANLNELALTFNDLEMGCYKVGGYFAVCNANLEDADIDLAAEILTALGQAIGIALDKAILYGRNASGTQKMPMGIVTRLLQESQPAGYPATARPWADLHTSNIITIASGTSGAALIAAIVTASGAAKGKYSRGEKVWVMNETTYTALMASTVSTDAQGRIVTGVADVMPVVGGIIEVLSFLPDNVIIGGYFDLYTLAERAGQKFATSEHVRFLQDQTVFKGTARYDGAPAIAEAFVAIGIGGTTPGGTMTFATDTASDPAAILLTSTASVAVGAKVKLAPQLLPAGASTTITWSSGTAAKATVDTNGEVTGVATGTSVITATTENGLTAQCTVTVVSA
jgi:HK97 family phage major capsid protein